MSDVRSEPAEGVEDGELPAPDEILDAASEEEEVNHVAEQVPESAVDEQGGEVGVPNRFRGDEAEVVDQPVVPAAQDAGIIGAEEQDQGDNVEERVDPDDGEGHDGVASCHVVHARWYGDKHVGERLVSVSLFCCGDFKPESGDAVKSRCGGENGSVPRWFRPLHAGGDGAARRLYQSPLLRRIVPACNVPRGCFFMKDFRLANVDEMRYPIT